MAEKPGWQGRFYEDFEVGDLYRHPLGRTVLAVDNSWFTLLTQNTAPIHFDRHYAAQTEFGQPLVDSTFTLALVTGQSVTDISQNVFANLGWDEVRFLAAYKRHGLRHILLEFRRDDLGRMLEILDLVAGTIRPAVDRVGFGRAVLHARCAYD